MLSIDCFSEENYKYFISGNEGQEIYAIDDGIVIDRGYDSENGSFIVLNYQKLKMNITYCNLSSFTYFFENQVKLGDKIGKIGMSGYTNKIGCNVIISLHDDFLYPIFEDNDIFRKTETKTEK